MSFGDNAKLDLLIARTVSEEARTNGGSLYAASLRRLWDMAYSIGLNRGEKNLVDVRKEGYQEGRLAAQREATALSEELEKHAWKCGFHEGRLESEERLDRYAGQLDKAYSVLEGVQQTLEAERVWGFDVGWALGQEVERSRQRSEACLLPSLPSLVSTASMATQTDPLPTPATVPDAPQSLLTFTIVPSVPFDWADDTTQDDPPMSPKPKPSCAIAPALSAPSTFMRDFSDLRTKSSQPFASLHKRRKRSARDPVCRPSHSRASRAPKTSDDPSASSRCSPPTIILNIYDSNNKKRHVRYPNPPSSRTPSHFPSATPPFAKNSHLDWGHDPRLRDLSRALTALAWPLPFVVVGACARAEGPVTVAGMIGVVYQALSSAAFTEVLCHRDHRSPLVRPPPTHPTDRVRGSEQGPRRPEQGIRIKSKCPDWVAHQSATCPLPQCQHSSTLLLTVAVAVACARRIRAPHRIRSSSLPFLLDESALSKAIDASTASFSELLCRALNSLTGDTVAFLAPSSHSAERFRSSTVALAAEDTLNSAPLPETQDIQYCGTHVVLGERDPRLSAPSLNLSFALFSLVSVWGADSWRQGKESSHSKFERQQHASLEAQDMQALSPVPRRPSRLGSTPLGVTLYPTLTTEQGEGDPG
ncbi:hypothetical protein FB45DRAFT_859258 [Roridomyces roridus]|uniref:Uncharacterized protein n=1 Tax=Roridomyces roridus TaxID=1738132 RepID=A0AAD7CJX9_9AGAR|nr:hypothetical protein FB45DRAFT_859258 [Roridomyces roridus]